MEDSDAGMAIARLAERVDGLEQDLLQRIETLERFIAAGRTVSESPVSESPVSDSPVSESPVSDSTVSQPSVPQTMPPPPPPAQTPTSSAVEPDRIPPPPTAADLIAPPISASWVPDVPKPKPVQLGMEDLLRIAGVVLVGLSAIFLVSTAISRGWISPELQLLGATLIGFAMLGSAFPLVESRRPWAATLGIGGAAVITVCAGAAYAWLDLVSPTTALLLVAAAAAISVAVAAQLRLQLVALAATAAMLLVPPFARLIVDGSVTVIGVWLGVFAVAATAVGVHERWMTYKAVSTWSTALWLLILAGTLAADGDASHLVAGSALVAVLSAVLWIGPTLSEYVDRQTGSPQASTLAGVALPSARTGLAFEYRAVALVPIWAWLSVVLFGGYGLDDQADRIAIIGLALAGGFLLAACVAYPVLRQISLVGFLSHLLGASLLVTLSLLVWLGGPLLIVALAAQALITLVIAYSFSDVYLKLNAGVLAALAWLLLAIDYVDVIQADSHTVGEHVSRGVVVASFAAMAWLVEQNEDRSVGEAINGFAWASVLGLAATFVSIAPPIFDDRGWLVAGAAAAAASLVSAKRLGQVVLAIGGFIALVTAIATALGILAATLVGLDGRGLGWPGHLGQLIVVLALIGVTYWAWNRGDHIPSTELFVVSWLFALGWVASVLVDVTQGQVGISVIWAVAACGAIIAGIGSRRAIVRHVGLGTLAVVLAKLLTVDLAEVETLWRVGLFLVIGLGLLRLGYVLPALVARYGGAPEEEPAGDVTAAER